MDIRDAYQTIVENPEALGYDSIEWHLDEIVNDIKEEVDQIFGIGINTEGIINILTKKYNMNTNIRIGLFSVNAMTE